MPITARGSIRLGLLAACGLVLLVGLGTWMQSPRGVPAEPAASAAERGVPAGAVPFSGAAVRAAQERGRQIYRQGRSRSGRAISALLQGSDTEVPASLMTCASCHGEDGRGRAEGGIEPSDLSATVLSHPGGARDRLGRKRPAYDGPLLARAIALGIDAGGRELGPGMPRHRMAQEDMADLVAYLQVIGHEPSPGLTDAEIHLGTLLPSQATSDGLGRAIRQTLEARIDQINQEGGIYRRRLVLHVQELPESPEQAGATTDAFLARVQPFALVACYLAGFEDPVGRVIEQHEVPTVGGFTPYPDATLPLNRWVFYVQAGLDHQGAALAQFAATQLSTEPGAKLKPRPAIVYTDEPRLSRVANAIARAWAGASERPPELEPKLIPVARQADADSIVSRLSRSNHAPIFVLGAADLLRDVVASAARASWYPYLLAPSALSGPELLEAPPGFDGRIFLAFPHLASDLTVAGAERYRRLEERAKLGRDHQAVRLATLASIETLAEGLARGGRRLGRDGLAHQLETLRRFESGFLPPLTFSTTERIGSKGAHILTIDLKTHRLRPLGVWVPAPDTR